MASKVQIANFALQAIGEEAIASLSDDSERARAVNRIFAQELRAELRAHPWNCAIKRVRLAALADAPAFEYSYQYQLPADCVRPLIKRNDLPDYKIEGRKLLTNVSGPLDFRYVYEITDMNEMDAALVTAFSLRLAYKIAPRLTQSRGTAQDAYRDYKDAIADAKKANAFEKAAEELPEDDWIQARL